MLTDWLIVRRIAAELDRALRGKRIRSAGRMPDGRFGLRTSDALVAIDAFGPTPIVTLEAVIALASDGGWLRAFAEALEGLRIDRVRARRGDRLVAFDCSSRSRFGVQSGYRLVIELVPRFGNLVLLRDDTVVAAAKEFAGNGGAARTTRVGDSYALPPLPAFAAGVSLAATLAALAGDDTARRRAAASRALRAEVPLVPRLVADSLVAEAAPLATAAPDVLAQRCIVRARAIVSATTGEADSLGDIYTYRDGERLVAAHVVPLAQYAALTAAREPALLPVIAASVGVQTRERGRAAFDARRARLRARIEKRRAALSAERLALVRERDDAAGRDHLRRAGELLYAHLMDVPAGATTFVPASDPTLAIELDAELDAKANAAAIFRRYRKATAKLEHVERRLRDLAAHERFAEEPPGSSSAPNPKRSTTLRIRRCDSSGANRPHSANGRGGRNRSTSASPKTRASSSAVRRVATPT